MPCNFNHAEPVLLQGLASGVIPGFCISSGIYPSNNHAATGQLAWQACTHCSCLPCSHALSASGVKPCNGCLFSLCSSFTGPEEQMIRCCRGCCSLAAASAYTSYSSSPVQQITASVPFQASQKSNAIVAMVVVVCIVVIVQGLSACSQLAAPFTSNRCNQHLY